MSTHPLEHANHSTDNQRPANTPTERRLTVGTQYYEVPVRVVEPRCAPWLQMRGDWVAAAGFDIQAPVRVRAMQGSLVVTVVEES